MTAPVEYIRLPVGDIVPDLLEGSVALDPRLEASPGLEFESSQRVLKLRKRDLGLVVRAVHVDQNPQVALHPVEPLLCGQEPEQRHFDLTDLGEELLGPWSTDNQELPWQLREPARSRTELQIYPHLVGVAQGDEPCAAICRYNRVRRKQELEQEQPEYLEQSSVDPIFFSILQVPAQGEHRLEAEAVRDKRDRIGLAHFRIFVANTLVISELNGEGNVG